MYHNSHKIIILYILCTLQLQPYLLTMASKPSTSTTTSTTAEQDPMPSTTKHCSWQEGVRCNSHLIYTQSCPYICCPAICDRCSRNNISLTSLQKDVHYRSIQKMQWDCSMGECYWKNISRASKIPINTYKVTILCSLSKLQWLEVYSNRTKQSCRQTCKQLFYT